MTLSVVSLTESTNQTEKEVYSQFEIVSMTFEMLKFGINFVGILTRLRKKGGNDHGNTKNQRYNSRSNNRH